MNAFGQIRAVPWRTKRPTAIANRLGRRAKDVAENLLSEEATETGRKYRVLGSDGHDEYVVEVAPTPSCSCPDKELPCKHLLFIYHEVLKRPETDPLTWQLTLLPHELTKLGVKTLKDPVTKREHEDDVEAGEAKRAKVDDADATVAATGVEGEVAPEEERDELEEIRVDVEEVRVLIKTLNGEEADERASKAREVATSVLDIIRRHSERANSNDTDEFKQVVFSNFLRIGNYLVGAPQELVAIIFDKFDCSGVLSTGVLDAYRLLPDEDKEDAMEDILKLAESFEKLGDGGLKESAEEEQDEDGGEYSVEDA